MSQVEYLHFGNVHIDRFKERLDNLIADMAEANCVTTMEAVGVLELTKAELIECTLDALND